ncbi:MAG TPA: phosphate ABC transporter substrate-binding protein [Candidatus Kapabacteria bacterium]|nr:phosphate ABC transporter substrate-binding protein [Candidatus Kapabacteria bacterium]
MPSRLVSILVLSFFAISCGGDDMTVLTMKGSDTMVQLAQRWAELYMKDKQGVQVQVTGGGSGTGISALINGTTDICAASRPMKDNEKQKLIDQYKYAGMEVRVARDGITLFVHGDNPVKEMTLDQIAKIYKGEITNWSEVGGADQEIVVYGRENSSGTYEYFKEHVLKKEDFKNGMQALSGTAAVVNAVGRDEQGIGFGGLGYSKGLKEIAVKPHADSAAYLPTKENILSGQYPISRYLYLYLRQRPEGEMKAFIDFILSKNGQEVVANEGFFPVTD